ncbi:hypothetical protein IAT38_006962 [Cryptococcus sp. DSM 104549]
MPTATERSHPDRVLPPAMDPEDAFARLLPVRDQILRETFAISPSTLLALSHASYDHYLPALYHTITASTALFRGLELPMPGQQRKLKALEHVEVLRIMDGDVLLKLYMMTFRAHMPRRYTRLFLNARVVEISKRVVEGRYTLVYVSEGTVAQTKSWEQMRERLVMHLPAQWEERIVEDEGSPVDAVWEEHAKSDEVSRANGGVMLFITRRSRDISQLTGPHTSRQNSQKQTPNR